MGFLQCDDYSILMDTGTTYVHPDSRALVPTKREITLDNMKALHDAGVKTVLNFIEWPSVEIGQLRYDWTTIDSLVDRNNQAGMKTLLMVPCGTIDWLPANYYVCSVSGATSSIRMLSPWCKQAMDYMEDFIRVCCNRYESDTVQCIWGAQREGETMLPPGLGGWQDAFAVADYRSWCAKHGHQIRKPDIGDDTIFYKKATDSPTIAWLKESMVTYCKRFQGLFREPWFCLHRAYSWTACCFIDEIYSSQTRQLWGIQFTHFPHGPLMATTIADMRKYKINMWAGSEWVEGLASNTSTAIAQDLCGLITSPIHPFTKHDTIKPWMIDVFRGAIERWRASEQAS